MVYKIYKFTSCSPQVFETCYLTIRRKDCRPDDSLLLECSNFVFSDVSHQSHHCCCWIFDPRDHWLPVHESHVSEFHFRLKKWAELRDCKQEAGAEYDLKEGSREDSLNFIIFTGNWWYKCDDSCICCLQSKSILYYKVSSSSSAILIKSLWWHLEIVCFEDRIYVSESREMFNNNSSISVNNEEEGC